MNQPNHSSAFTKETHILKLTIQFSKATIFAMAFLTQAKTLTSLYVRPLFNVPYIKSQG